jgi:hypothetical protein
MARGVDVPLGELFVSLILTQSELRTRGSHEQYQQLVIFNIIKELGFDIEVIIQISPLARFQINRGKTASPQGSQQGQKEHLRNQPKDDVSASAFI